MFKRHTCIRTLASRLVSAMLVLLASTTTQAAGSEQDLERWITASLIPGLEQQLASHPRFRGQPLGIAVMQGQSIVASPDGLSVDVRDRLDRSLRGTAGVVMARESVLPDWQRPGGPPRLDCRPGNGRYLIGVSADGAGHRRAHVQVRILDLDENAWVSGFAYDWRGRLSGEQAARLARSTAVESLRGQRDLPFQPGQPDLLAARLAFTLGCGLLAQPEIGISAWVDDEADDGTLKLVGSYLARADVLRLTDSRADADVILSARTHDVSGQLKQYWVSLRPTRDTDLMPSLEAATYVSSPASTASVPAAAALVDVPVAPALEGHRIAFDVLRLPHSCRPGRCAWSGETLDPRAPLPSSDRLALEVRSDVEQRAVILAMTERGLVRLAPSQCGDITALKVGPGLRLRHPLDATELPHGPRSVFVIATTPGKTAHRLASLANRVPADCSRGTMSGTRLEHWLSSLDDLARDAGSALSWEALRLRYDDGDKGMMANR